MAPVKVGNLSINVETAGTGPPLLFIGGTGWDLRQNRVPLEPPWTDHFQVALFDQRGMGRSEKPSGPYRMADFADDAAGVLDVLGWARASIVGYSFGGMVAQELAIRRPERVGKLVLAATSSGGAGGSSYPIHEFLGLDPLQRARRGLEVADKRFTSAFQLAHPDQAEHRVAQRAARQTRYMDEAGARTGLVEQLKARAAHDTYERLPQIGAKTMLVAGIFDGQAPAYLMQSMHNRIAGSKLVLVEGAHDFLTENEQFAREAIRFCQQPDPA